MDKSSDYADGDISKLCRSILPHPVRCHVKRGKDIIFAPKWTHAGLNLSNFSEIYESEKQDMQVDGSPSSETTTFLFVYVAKTK